MQVEANKQQLEHKIHQNVTACFYSYILLANYTVFLAAVTITNPYFISMRQPMNHETVLEVFFSYQKQHKCPILWLDPMSFQIWGWCSLGKWLARLHSVRQCRKTCLTENISLSRKSSTMNKQIFFHDIQVRSFLVLTNSLEERKPLTGWLLHSENQDNWKPLPPSQSKSLPCRLILGSLTMIVPSICSGQSFTELFQLSRIAKVFNILQEKWYGMSVNMTTYLFSFSR